MKRFLVFATLSLIIACNSDDEPPFNANLLLNKKWYLASGKITEVGQTRDLVFDTCKLDNDLEFRQENLLVLYFGAVKCQIAEPDSFLSEWRLTEDKMKLDLTDYEVIELTTNTLNLRQTSIGIDPVEKLIAEVIYKPR